MVWIGEREITMPRGWIAHFKDGSAICEEDMSWKEVPNKKEIQRMILKWEDRIWTIDNKKSYTAPMIRGFVDISPSGGISPTGVDSKARGYYDTESNCKVYIRVDELNGQMNHEIQEIT